MRDVGRKYRSLSEELKKELEELRAAKLALEKRVEEGQQSASSAASSDIDTINELRQQVDKLTQVGNCLFLFGAATHHIR